MVTVVDDHTAEGTTTRFVALVKDAVAGRIKRVAFDCEGVNLGRLGTLEVASLCFENEGSESCPVFVVDVGANRSTGSSSTPRNQRIAALKQLFESEMVEKVIHDCRKDCDALAHLFGIQLNQVHDTSCFHFQHTGETLNLNDLLSYHGLAVNGHRDSSIYRRNYKFWATRPLTHQMIEWAGEDVDKLLSVATMQMNELSGANKRSASIMSKNYSKQLSSMKVARGLTCNVSIGHFIGTRGKNVTSLRKRTGTMIYQENGVTNQWYVYYNNDAALAAVKRAMGHW